MRNSVLLSLLFILLAGSSNAQVTSDTLSWEGFIAIIRKNHPVSQQAQLLERLARARKLQALGNFDPKLSLDYDRKLFDGTEYYTFTTPEVKLPLWFGLELKANYTEAEGAYINPQNKVPKEGLSYAGVSIPLGKGLLMDRRRASLRQARIFAEASENEQRAILNDLYMQAGESYINWQNNYRIFKIYEGTLELAKVRFEAVKRGFRGGDRPAIDTIEALTVLQQRELQLQEASLELQNALYELSTFLWLENNTAVDPEKLSIRPQNTLVLPLTADTDITNNPKLLSYEFKLRDLAIERRLKAESLRPELNLQLGLLNKGRTPLRNLNADYWNNNNKIGLQFAFPLTLSTARGELAEAKIKIQNTQLEQTLARNELENKARQNIAELTNLQNQLQILRQSYTANEQLLKGEEMRFRLGESSLFLVNSRESKLLELNEKILATEAKIKKAQLKVLWLSGELPEKLESLP
ncbi:TolC family protein [Pedobacter sp. SYSU D00535]|uniref:TolC family protein n=1 Tax=Pedobacter sp. SYSU D00535 TaxID=2810308 RepID=UPI001A958EF9|nr:TolC family protein [Pedobacter sp. SYSU D00535]